MNRHNYAPGYDAHCIQLRLVGETPWAWRDGIVTESTNGHHRIQYYFEEGSIDVWSARISQIPVGTMVQVHELYYCLALGNSVASVRIDAGGLGAIPQHDGIGSCQRPIVRGIADLSTGLGILPSDV